MVHTWNLSNPELRQEDCRFKTNNFTTIKVGECVERKEGRKGKEEKKRREKRKGKKREGQKEG